MGRAQLVGSLGHSRIATLVLVVAVLIFPSLVDAVTPVARWDVVPHQSIAPGEQFKAGIVAFSKAGVDRVVVTVNGQGYRGPNPLESTSMAWNDRTGVYEYWVSVDATDFASHGPITLSARVYGLDGDFRDLEDLPLVAMPPGAPSPPFAWVSASGDDRSARIGDPRLPFPSIAAALSAIASAKNGDGSGAVVSLYEGSYQMGNAAISSELQWLTIRAADGLDPSVVQLNPVGSASATRLLRLSGLTIQGTTALRDPEKLWVDGAVVLGGGRHTVNSNPILRGDLPTFHTDSVITDTDFGVQGGVLARGVQIYRIGNDAFQNTLMVINARVDDVDPGNTYWHADAYQSFGDGPRNRIVYGYYGTNLHYQGLFLRQENKTAAVNNAFVNVFLEMRPPGRPGYHGDPNTDLVSGAFVGVYDHLIVWHCSFPTHKTYLGAEPDFGQSLTNSSFIGNLFYEYGHDIGPMEEDPAYAAPANSNGNEFIDNHYIWSCVDQGNCGPSEPSWHSKSPDTAVPPSQSLGDPGLQLQDPLSPTYGVPESASPLYESVAQVRIGVDVFGNYRGTTASIGAIEAEAPISDRDSPSDGDGRLAPGRPSGLRVESAR